MNAIPIKTWIDDPSDGELEGLWNLLKELAIVDDVPKVLNEIRVRKWDLNAGSVHKLIQTEFIPSNRGPFNSPVHNNGEKKFEFDDEDDQ